MGQKHGSQRKNPDCYSLRFLPRNVRQRLFYGLVARQLGLFFKGVMCRQWIVHSIAAKFNQ